MYPFKDTASRFVGPFTQPDHMMTGPCLRQLCPGDYRQPNYFAGPDGRGPWSVGRDFWIPDNQCTPVIGTKLRYTTGHRSLTLDNFYL